MPLPIAHGFTGAAIVAAIHPKINKIISIPLLLGGFLANAADIDFILTLSTGDKSWHRGFTHSILFAVLVFVLIVAVLGKDRMREAIAFGSAYFSHLVLDFATSDGGGPQLFWFLSRERFSVGYKSFSVVPSRLPVSEIFTALIWETAVFGLIFVIVFYLRTRIIDKT